MIWEFYSEPGSDMTLSGLLLILVSAMTTYCTTRLAKIYIKEVVMLHGVPVSIVFDRDPKVTS